MTAYLKTRITILLGIFLFVASATQAQEAMQTTMEPEKEGITLNAKIALLSDYRSEGISQTSENSTIQGSFTFTAPNGWYGGVWASNIDSGGSIEQDYYTGFTRTLREGVVGNIDFTYYHYQGDTSDPDLDYWEVKGSMTFDDLTVGIVYADNYSKELGAYYYPFVDYSLGLSDLLSLDFHLAYNYFNNVTESKRFFSDDTDSFVDWGITLSAEAMGATWSIAAVGTDIGSSKTCFGDSSLCRPALVFGVSKSL